MGMMAAPLAIGVLGLGTAYAVNQMSKGMFGGQANKSESALQQLQNDNQTALDNLPVAPEAPSNDPADNSAAEEERKAALQAAALADNQNNVNPTGGQGVLGIPPTNKKELLGS